MSNDQQEQIATLKAENDNLKLRRSEFQSERDIARNTIETLKAENEKLKTALINWGQHKSYCDKDELDEMAKCICGYDKALKGFGAYYETT